MKILFVIVTYNAMPWIDKCFQSIADNKSKIECDALVVDNGSTDGSQAYLKENYPWVIFQQSIDNLGFGRANNIGLQYALDNNYDYAYLLNQDAWVLPETVASLIEIARKHPEYGILSPFQMSADQYSIDKAFSTRIKSGESYFAILNDLYNNRIKDVYPVESVMAAHWFITKKCIETVGGFSPTFPHYGEDDNYSERVKYKGLKIGVVPGLKVVHDREYRQTDNNKHMYLDYADGLYRLSCPEVRVVSTFRYIILRSFRSSVSFKSLQPIKYLWLTLKSYRRIRQNRIISIKDNCSFLVNNNHK